MTTAFAGSWEEITDNRPALYTAIIGTALGAAALALGAMALSSLPVPEPPPSDLAFEPGFIARLGTEDAEATDPGAGSPATEATPPEPDTPEPAEPAEPADSPAMTTEPHVEPSPPRPRKPTPRRAPSPASKLPGPDAAAARGRPLARRDGFSDLQRSGDRWATDVMAALSSMRVGAFARDLSGSYRFRLTICSDGSIKNVSDAGGSIAPEGRARVRLALQQLQLPRAPPHIRNAMGGARCKRLGHVFVWTATKVR